jgi:hypothetical protein
LGSPQQWNLSKYFPTMMSIKIMGIVGRPCYRIPFEFPFKLRCSHPAPYAVATFASNIPVVRISWTLQDRKVGYSLPARQSDPDDWYIKNTTTFQSKLFVRGAQYPLGLLSFKSASFGTVMVPRPDPSSAQLQRMKCKGNRPSWRANH